MENNKRQRVVAKYIHRRFKRLYAVKYDTFVILLCNLELRLEDEYLLVAANVVVKIEADFANGIIVLYVPLYYK